LSCERFRMTPPPSTPCSDSDICAMSKVSKVSLGGMRTWKAGGGEGLRSCDVGFGGPHSKARFCSGRSRWDHEEQLSTTRQRCTPGYIQPGSC